MLILAAMHSLVIGCHNKAWLTLAGHSTGGERIPWNRRHSAGKEYKYRPPSSLRRHSPSPLYFQIPSTAQHPHTSTSPNPRNGNTSPRMMDRDATDAMDECDTCSFGSSVYDGDASYVYSEATKHEYDWRKMLRECLQRLDRCAGKGHEEVDATTMRDNGGASSIPIQQTQVDRKDEDDERNKRQIKIDDEGSGEDTRRRVVRGRTTIRKEQLVRLMLRRGKVVTLATHDGARDECGKGKLLSSRAPAAEVGKAE
ncbi:hypothetical protein DFH27DRAFT_655629 [Peziza echinospora]|nr:hypothetical protein DFH27DRAFT_655629 [Peziza echinospora]